MKNLYWIIYFENVSNEINFNASLETRKKSTTLLHGGRKQMIYMEMTALQQIQGFHVLQSWKLLKESRKDNVM